MAGRFLYLEHGSARLPFWAYGSHVHTPNFAGWIGVEMNIYIYIYIDIYIYMVPCPVFPPPPWDGGGMMPLWYIPTYLPTYLRTYIHTYHYITLPYITLPYITLPYIPYIHTYHYITLPYITLPYITLPYIPYIHTYIPTYQHTNIPTYQRTNVPTYQHTNIPPPQATGGGDQKNHTTTTGHRGGDQKNHTTTTGHRGGDQKNQTILSTHTHWWGGGGGWPTLHHIYIHIYTYIYRGYMDRHLQDTDTARIGGQQWAGSHGGWSSKAPRDSRQNGNRQCHFWMRSDSCAFACFCYSKGEVCVWRPISFLGPPWDIPWGKFLAFRGRTSGNRLRLGLPTWDLKIGGQPKMAPLQKLINHQMWGTLSTPIHIIHQYLANVSSWKLGPTSLVLSSARYSNMVQYSSVQPCTESNGT